MGDFMVNYPNKKEAYKDKNISAAHRGMTLERDINDTNKYYLDTDKAAIYKKPTPITIVNVDYKSRETAKITEAYFQIPSTTDYNGVYRGQYIDFEAKETHSRTSMPLSMIHQHQLDHLARVLKYGGIAFLIVRFAVYDETYFVPADRFLKQIASSTARSVKHEWFQENCTLIPYNYVIKVNYLQIVDKIIDGGNF
ncbi:MAG: recombination protein U [Erysipelotrichaceae bacterium]|nr:recombination protein U [Erysipelotrichaceae bacterium]